MLSHQDNVSIAPTGAGLIQSNSMLDQPLTPPPEAPMARQPHEQIAPRHSDNRISGAMGDNTASGMAMSQEDAMYLSPASSPDISLANEKERSDPMQEDMRTEGNTIKYPSEPETIPPSDACRNGAAMSVSRSDNSEHPYQSVETTLINVTNESEKMDIDECNSTQHVSTDGRRRSQTPCESKIEVPPGLAKIDLTLDRFSQTRPWDFTQKFLKPKYPSSLFRSSSRYRGTQQSDRQIYNVDVTILTVDMEQSSLSGYLLIRDLTPEHEMLQTFFTGEIIGGPNQKYSFRTSDPAWGANDKTDLTHWARFPAWRHLSWYAKRDINFRYPLDNEPWWQQENIFMRWKEHFLVPDHKTRSIQGASFEGFYYICLNQIEGKISGIYFHSKSEKFQQLELRHEGKQGVWAPGVSPIVEFR